MIFLFCERANLIFSSKKGNLKDGISRIIQRNDILPRRCSNSFDRKNKEGALISLM